MLRAISQTQTEAFSDALALLSEQQLKPKDYISIIKDKEKQQILTFKS